MTPDEDRIQRYLDGQLSEDDAQVLQREVVANAELRQAYVEAAWLHGALRAERHSLPALLEEPAPVVTHPWRFNALTAAAAALVTLSIVWLVTPNDKPVATLSSAANCKWAASDLPTTEGAQLKAGKLDLVEGMATLSFASGATVTLEAPSTIELVSAMHCKLVQGSVVADVPESAHGFLVQTPELKVIDHGTRFGVTAGATGNSQVFVFEGLVEIGERPGAEAQKLKGGESFTHLPVDAQNPEPRHSLPRESTRDVNGWKSITTAFGGGKDSFVRFGTQSPLGDQPLVMVKHTDLAEKNQRKGYLTFDLSLVRSEVRDAELLLDFESSGLGFSTLVPDSKFAVYGLTDESLDGWDEAALTWDNAPANTPGAGLEEPKVRRLLEFGIERGSSGRLVTVGGSALADFLNQDTNGLATFIIVRLTGESETAGLVHAFASKENSSARPPTLRLKTQ